MSERPGMRSEFARGPALRPIAPTPQPQAPKRRQTRRIRGWMRHRWWIVLIGVIVFFSLVFLVVGYINTKNQLNALNGSGKGATEAQQLANQIGKTVDLPTDETPSVATVNDASKLKSQVFFNNAQNGDKVLIYSKANRAVLYRPSTKKIIEFSRGTLAPATTTTKP